MYCPPQLIVFIEIDAKEVRTLINDIDPICHLRYPYEYHLTIGWFTDESLDRLREWGPKTVSYVKQLLFKLDCDLLMKGDTAFQIVVNGAARQPLSRGGGFYLQPNDQTISYLNEIHQQLIAFLQENQINISESLSDYRPHVSFTTPMTYDIINLEQEKIVLQTINDKIAAQNEVLPGTIILQPIAIRSILKYQDEAGIERKEIWDVKKRGQSDSEKHEINLRYVSSSSS